MDEVGDLGERTNSLVPPANTYASHNYCLNAKSTVADGPGLASRMRRLNSWSKLSKSPQQRFTKATMPQSPAPVLAVVGFKEAMEQAVSNGPHEADEIVEEDFVELLKLK